MKTRLFSWLILGLSALSLCAARPPIFRNQFDTNDWPTGLLTTNYTIYSSAGGGSELIRGDGGSAYLEIATSRMHRDVNDEVLSILGAQGKSVGAFIEIYGQDHPTGLGGIIGTIHHPGFFEIRSAQTNSTTSALRWDLHGYSGDIRHFSAWTNASLVYTSLWMRPTITAPATAVGSYHMVVQTNGGAPVFVIKADTGNVGIGTASPGADLEVNNTSSSPSIRIRGADTGSPYLQFNQSANLKGFIQYKDNGASTDYIEIQSDGHIYLNPTGNVGIGTNAPARQLVLAGPTVNLDFAENGRSVYGLTMTADGDAGLGLYDRTAAAYRMFWDEAGQVGIGTTSPDHELAIASVNDPADLSLLRDDDIIVDANYLGRILFRGDDPAGTGGQGAEIRSEAAGTWDTTDTPGRLMFFTTPSGSGTPLERMRLTSSGNVGIGTNAPQARLHVFDAVPGGAAAPALDDILVIDSDSHAYINFRTTNANSGILFSDGTRARGQLFYDHRDDAFKLYTSTTERMCITSTGNVGIGTNAPAYNLHIGPHSSGVANLMLTHNASINWGLIATTAGDDGLGFYDVDAAAYRMIIDESGQVGIGTTTPESSLHVNAGGFNIPIYVESTDGRSMIAFADNASANWAQVLVGAETNDMVIWSGGAETLRVESGGNVGIGTNAPTTKLEVRGFITQFHTAATMVMSNVTEALALTVNPIVITNFNQNLLSDNTAVNLSTGQIIVTNAGNYLLCASISFQGAGGGETYRAYIGKGTWGTNECLPMRREASSSDTGNMSVQGFIALTNAEMVSIMIKDVTGSSTVTFNDVVFSLSRM